MKSPLVVIIGPSGSGKSSVAKVLCESFGFTPIKTVTTRPQRDAYDTDHTFVDKETYQAMVAAKAFFGTIHSFGHDYGLPRFNPDKPTLLLLRAPVIEEFKTMFSNAYVIEIDAPITVLKERLSLRGSVDRMDDEFLEKEIAWGQKIADLTIDSSKESATKIAERIIQLVRKGSHTT